MTQFSVTQLEQGFLLLNSNPSGVTNTNNQNPIGTPNMRTYWFLRAILTSYK
jgi:hypothetical protein